MYASNVRLNVGCGLNPTPGWTNLDNSRAVLLRRIPLATRLATLAGVVDDGNRLARGVTDAEVIYADVRKGLRFPDESVLVVYSSHMIEHLDRTNAQRFLDECFRVLRPGGILRLVVPDLGMLLDRWKEDSDADALVEQMWMHQEQPHTLKDRLRYHVVGFRDHRWMYTTETLSRCLTNTGFTDIRALQPGETTIPDPGDLNLFEKAGESMYLEAVRPSRTTARPGSESLVPRASTEPPE